MTYTYARVEIGKEAYQEVKAKLLKADYGHVVGKTFGGEEFLDMDELALIEGKPRPITGREFALFFFGVIGGGVATAIGMLSLKVIP